MSASQISEYLKNRNFFYQRAFRGGHGTVTILSFAVKCTILLVPHLPLSTNICTILMVQIHFFMVRNTILPVPYPPFIEQNVSHPTRSLPSLKSTNYHPYVSVPSFIVVQHSILLATYPALQYTKTSYCYCVLF